MTRKRVLLCSLLLSLIYVIPIAVFNKGLNGADLSFHLNRLLGMEGIYASPINFKAFYGIGLGVNYFYPFLTYYPFFVLYRLSHSVFLGYYIYQYLLTIITFLIAYYSVSNIMVIENKENKKDFAGLLFATLYTFSLYRLDNIVIRFATGEFIAYAFIPLVFYGLYNILKGDYRKWYILSIGMALVAYSHLISLLLTALLVGFIFIIAFVFVNSKKERLLSFLVHWPENSEHIVSSIQFIWRLNTFITLFTAYLASKVFVNLSLRKEYFIAVLIGVIGLTTFFTVSQAQRTIEGPQTTFNNMPKEELLPIVINGEYHATDYMLSTDGSISDYDAFQRKLRHEVINLEDNQIVETKILFNSLKTKLIIDSDKKLTVSLPFYAYKGLSVELDRHSTSFSKAPDAGVEVVIPKGKHEIGVSYSYTILAKCFFLVSLVSTLAVVFYGIYIYRSE